MLNLSFVFLKNRCLCFVDRMWLDILMFEIVDDVLKNEKVYGN